MRKLFISQPMNGLSDTEIKETREKILAKAKETVKDDVELIDSFFENAPHDAKPLWFLGKSFELLSTADIVYFGEGWDKARGCIMEHEAAKKYLQDNGVIIIEDN